MNWESLLTRQYKGTTGGFEHCSNGRIICAFLTFAQMEYDFVNLESNKNKWWEATEATNIYPQGLGFSHTDGDCATKTNSSMTEIFPGLRA